MLTEERYNKILEALKNKGTITVAEMTECTGASESTIRRDLIALDEMGKLNKVHGGATAVAHQFIADEIAVSVKEQLCVEEKKAIARYAVNMINDDDFIFIDAGTSTGWMIEVSGINQSDICHKRNCTYQTADEQRTSGIHDRRTRKAGHRIYGRCRCCK